MILNGSSWWRKRQICVGDGEARCRESLMLFARFGTSGVPLKADAGLDVGGSQRSGTLWANKACDQES